MQESDIRDLLVKQLDCLESDLQFLKKEKYIPSNIGTNSFIDILARDTNNNWVIIELKRSNNTARQAIHEVLKYVEAIKAYLGARDDEIRVMIVSTEWDELLIPFSRFCADTSLDVTGFFIDISNPKNFKSQKIEPLKITAGRVLSPWHELNFYTDKENLQRGIESHVQANSSKGIDDYVLVVLEAPPGHHEATLAATRHGLENLPLQHRNEVNQDEINAILENMEEHKYILYFVPQLLTKEACIDALQRADEDMEELLEILEDMEEEETLCTLHEHLSDAAPRAYREYFAIGYPAKFHHLTESEGWSISEIKRYGSLQHNESLTDNAIISEICGETGSSGQTFKRRISTASKPQLAMARSEIENCLSANPIWRSNILAHLDEIKDNYPDSDIDISIFNPATGLFTLFFAASGEEGTSFVPMYSMMVEHSEGVATLFFGELEAGENKRTFREVVDKFYSGHIGALMLSTAGGYREQRDVELLDFIGIQYRSYRYDINGKEREFYVWRDNMWREIDPIVPYLSLARFFERETIFMTHLVTKISRRMNGGIFDASCTDQPLRELIDPSSSDGPQHTISDLASHCDRCQCAFVEENFMVDAAVPSVGGAWAYLCADCVAETGATIGWGKGQLYQRLESGDWRLVAGGPPDTDAI